MTVFSDLMAYILFDVYLHVIKECKWAYLF